MVSTSDCGSENPGSNPGSGNFLLLENLSKKIGFDKNNCEKL